MRKLLLALATLWPSVACAQGIDSTGAAPTVFPSIDGTELQVHLEPTQLFWDDFTNGAGGTTLDTTNRWNAVTTGSGGTATASAGAYQLNSNTTAGGFAYITSQAKFQGPNPGYLAIQHQINIESPVLLNSYRFWGVGTIPATPTAAAPLTDAVGFAIGIEGHLHATSWAGGTKAFDLDLSVPNQGQYLAPSAGQKFDAGIHRYQISFRGDFIQWYVDGNLVARVPNGSAGPLTNTLPVAFLAVNNTSPPTANPTLVDNLAVVADSGRNAAALKDGTFGWRTATVTAAGAITTTLVTPPAGTTGAGYPPGATPLTASATGTTGAVAATLTGVASKFTYICGFQVTSSGATTPTALTVTVTGTVTGTLNYVYPVVAVTNDNQAPLIVPFTPCVPSSAAAGSIVVNLNTGIGTGGTAEAVTATGFVQ